MLIPTAKNTRNITDFRKDPDSILEAANKIDGPLYLFRGSSPKAVVLNIEEFARLRDEIEDYRDSLLAIELEKDPHRHEGAISFDQFLKQNNIKIKGRKRSSNSKNA